MNIRDIKGKKNEESVEKFDLNDALVSKISIIAHYHLEQINR